MKLFGGGKPDHPMAELKQARRLLEELPTQDSFKMAEELAHWIESVSTFDDFKPEYRLQLLLLIDENAQAPVRKLSREYLASVRPSKYQENRLWGVIHEYWKQAGLAYVRVVDQVIAGVKGVDALKAQLPLLLARALRSVAQRIKWQHMRYGPVDGSAWSVLNKVYAFAESRKLVAVKVVMYPAVPGDSTPQLEYLKAVIFSASSPDSLLPLEVEIAERMIGEYASRVALAASPVNENGYWIDLAQGVGPARLARVPQPVPATVRYFGARSALGELEKLIDAIQDSGAVPSSVNLGGDYDTDVVVGVLRHLASYWSPEPPERKHPRHNVKSRLSVAHGFDGVLGVLGTSDSLDFDTTAVESWIVENVSAGGFGAVIPQIKGDWLRVGAMLALQPEGGTNWVLGLVRRVNKGENHQARVGIQTLSKSPVVSQFSLGVAAEQGIVLKGAEPEHGESSIALRSGVFAPTQNLEADRNGKRHVYMPVGLVERGDDYEIGRFREMIRE
jgi:hypothetical protein